MLANVTGYEIYEINASDERSSKHILQILEYSQTATLSGAKRLFLIDEVDNIDRSVERGSVGLLSELLNKTYYPVIFTANEWVSWLSGIKGKCLYQKFRKIREGSIVKKLREICQKELILADEPTLTTIAEMANGDVRAAIQDLEMYWTKSRRSERLEIFSLPTVILSKSIKQSWRVINQLDMDIEEYVVRLYDIANELFKSNKISADEFKVVMDKLTQIDLMVGRQKLAYGYGWNKLKRLLSFLSIGKEIGVFIKPSMSIWTNIGQRNKFYKSLNKGHQGYSKYCVSRFV